MADSFRFATGAQVRVRDNGSEGHVRTPTYLRGKNGVVAWQIGHFRNPEELAYGKYDGATQPLYTVRFTQKSLWPGYSGGAADTLTADIFEHWLDPL